jgi:hypothetical protein
VGLFDIFTRAWWRRFSSTEQTFTPKKKYLDEVNNFLETRPLKTTEHVGIVGMDIWSEDEKGCEHCWHPVKHPDARHMAPALPQWAHAGMAPWASEA